MSGPLYAGVDAGGTRTRLVLIDDQGELRARGEGGPGNLRRVGAAGLAQALTEARDAAGPDLRPAAAFLGVAGASSAEDRAQVAEVAERIELAPAGRIGVDHDLRIAHAAAFDDEPGIVVVAGTGSAAYGRDAHGTAERAGGWGPTLDDPGSAYDLARRALTACVRAADGRGPATELLTALVRELDARDLRDAVRRIEDGRVSRAQIAALAPHVLAAAERGDGVAQAAVAAGVEELACCAVAVAQRLGPEERGPVPRGDFTRAPRVALAGGLAVSDAWRDAFEAALADRLPGAAVRVATTEPALGAARLARRRAAGR
ncbi:MAG: BadF/BadG/BcrA/BcrD ATPase family protein [Planctomycetota bacterium]